MGMTTAGSKEINVTPLIDVLLVLLIIFLVMMPIMLRQETVELPPVVADAIPIEPAVELKLAADLTVTIGDEPAFASAELATQLRKKLHANQPVFVDFVDGVPWREVIGIVDTVHGVAHDLGGDPHVAVRLRNAEPI
jgi:biopolymer transport protein TolR